MTRDHAPRLAFALFLALVGCSHESPELPVVLGPTPFAAQSEGRIETATSLDAVPTDSSARLSWLAAGAVSYDWSLDVPAGSLAVLSDPSAPSPSFTPDVDGGYEVFVTVGLADGSFVLESRRITAATRLGASACATCHITRAAEAAETPHRNCETCHGPGSEHSSDPRRIAVSLRTEICGLCHNGFIARDRVTPWRNSPHSAEPPAAALENPDCQRCHTSRGFLRLVRGQPFQPDPPGAVGATCGVCHNPHSRANAELLRIFGEVPLVSGGEFDGGRGAACIVCHQSDVADPAAHAASGGTVPCAVQADMLGARGAVEYGLNFSTSFHGLPAFRLRLFTGDPDDSDTPDACVICHMAPDDAVSQPNVLGGHALLMHDSGEELAEGNCDRCHPGLTTFDRNLGADFDGDGVANGVQTEVRGLIEILFQALAVADTGGGLSRPGGANSEVLVDPDLSLTTPELRQAAFNYNFVVSDHSAGVHNTSYAVQLLQRTYEQVTGIPFKTAFPLADIR